ncbi:MAG: hypothetical protein V2G42_06540 [bacterium JZ-2024 1]
MRDSLRPLSRCLLTATFLFLLAALALGCRSDRNDEEKKAKSLCFAVGGVEFIRIERRDGTRLWLCIKPAPPPPEPEPNFVYVAHKDENRDGRIRKADGEMWCQDSEGLHGPCQVVTYDDAAVICSEEGGAWSQTENGYECRMTAHGFSQLFHDGNGDGYVALEDYHCETLNENGEPSGSVVTCPMDDVGVE